MEQQFDTPLGIIKCGLNSNDIISLVGIKKYENGQSKIFKTIGYRVEIISFKIRLPLYNGENVAESRGWIFRIEKINSADEMLEAYCMLSSHLGSTEFDSATGEHLDAIQADNSEWTLHIGTEDGEVLNARAENDDWFPSRLKNDVDFCQSITEMKQNGLITKIPHLNKGEKLHIQYLIAYDKKDESKVNTWLAVDESKRNLENWIGLW
jgi:hypothetical protein